MIVNGSLQAEGDLENPISFTNDRLDEPFASSPGQWGGIVFLEDSKDNYFKYTTLKNALFGVNLNIYNPDNEPDLMMENCFVGNMAISSVISLNSDFSAINSVFIIPYQALYLTLAEEVLIIHIVRLPTI